MTPPPGSIPLCPHKGCAFKCCDFKQMVHILLYPGEIEDARAQGRSLAHLEILEQDYHGGVRVRCRAGNTATCDGGYKPLDCVSYPFFPELHDAPDGGDEKPILKLSKGGACPIAGHEIPFHERYVKSVWKKLLEERPAVAAWLESFGVIQTDSFDPEPYETL
jgi:hypothetical protein